MLGAHGAELDRSVNASAGDVIMVNPGEIHDGAPLDVNARGWRMVYFDPDLVARELREEIVAQIESTKALL